MIKNKEVNANQAKAPVTIADHGRRVKRAYATIIVAVMLLMALTVPAFAAGDPLSAINNMADFIFSAIKAIGAILLGFGVVQIGLAFKSHDASQRAQGLMTFFGGLVIYFAKDILDLVLK